LESYLLAWYFAANHTKTDAFDKRGKKGFVFTIGDEPCLKQLPLSAVKSIMGDTAVGQATYSMENLLAAAQAKNHVYHIHVNHGRNCDSKWKELLGQNLIEITDRTTVSRVISDIILSYASQEVKSSGRPTGADVEKAPIYSDTVVSSVEDNLL